MKNQAMKDQAMKDQAMKDQAVSHPILCRCGALSGEVGNTRLAVHGVCYCKDCRAYAFHLGAQQTILDAMGGTEFVATQARYVAFTKGTENLACLSLSPNGLLRWYAKCCNTPIANTTRDWRLPYVGLIHTCLKKPLEDSFRPVQMHVNTKSAKGSPPSMLWSQARALGRFIPRIILGRMTGKYRQTPFFSSDGKPLVEVKVLSREEREQAKSAA